MIKKDMFLVNTSILVACIFLAFPVCFINLKRIVYDRRMFYDRGYYMSQIQYLPFKKGNELFSEGEFEKARDKYSTVVTLQKSGYYSHAAIERIGYIDSIVDFREALFSVLNPDKHSVLTVTDYRGMILLKTIFPGSFDFHLDVASGKVRQAILDYIQLYDAVKENDYDAVKELIGKNGWCWFEQDVWEMFSVDDRDAVMEKLSYYLAMETEDDAIKRLRFKWSVEE